MAFLMGGVQLAYKANGFPYGRCSCSTLLLSWVVCMQHMNLIAYIKVHVHVTHKPHYDLHFIPMLCEVSVSTKTSKRINMYYNTTEA